MTECKNPRISKQDLAWLAGLLEGEGCFSLQKYIQTARAGYALPSIEISMTDRDVVQRAGSLLGGKQASVRAARLDKRFSTKKRLFIWRVNGQRAVHVIKVLLPYMGRRRSKRILELVRNYEKSVGPDGALGYQRFRGPPSRKLKKRLRVRQLYRQRYWAQRRKKRR